MKQPGRPFYGISNRERLNKIWPRLINLGERLKELAIFGDEELERAYPELNKLITMMKELEELVITAERKINA